MNRLKLCLLGLTIVCLSTSWSLEVKAKPTIWGKSLAKKFDQEARTACKGLCAPVIFQPGYYLRTYVDLSKLFGKYNYKAAKEHWLKFGIKEGRRGSPVFDSKYYLNRHKDLKKLFRNDYRKALQHFLDYGAREGRQTAANFNVRDYLSKNRLVAARLGARSYKAAFVYYLRYLPPRVCALSQKIPDSVRCKCPEGTKVVKNSYTKTKFCMVLGCWTNKPFSSKSKCRCPKGTIAKVVRQGKRQFRFCEKVCAPNKYVPVTDICKCPPGSRRFTSRRGRVSFKFCRMSPCVVDKSFSAKATCVCPLGTKAQVTGNSRICRTELCKLGKYYPRASKCKCPPGAYRRSSGSSWTCFLRRCSKLNRFFLSEPRTSCACPIGSTTKYMNKGKERFQLCETKICTSNQLVSTKSKCRCMSGQMPKTVNLRYGKFRQFKVCQSRVCQYDRSITVHSKCRCPAKTKEKRAGFYRICELGPCPLNKVVRYRSCKCPRGTRMSHIRRGGKPHIICRK